MNIDLHGRRAFVTGSTAEIGSAIVQELAASGAAVVAGPCLDGMRGVTRCFHSAVLTSNYSSCTLFHGFASHSLAAAIARSDMAGPESRRYRRYGHRVAEGFALASDHGVAQWQNLDFHHAGVVRLIGSFDAHGMPCRMLDCTIRFEELGNSPDHYVVNWCRLSDGEWKIVELAE